MKYTLRAVAFALSLSLVGCSFSGSESEPDVPPLETLRNAPVELSVSGKRLSLDTYMWRDFQPISPEDGKPLIAIFRAVTADSSAMPEGLEIESAWVVRESEIWSARFSDENPPPNEQTPYQLYKIARGGPKFGPNVYVDAVVRLENTSGESYLLRAENQLIERTD